MRIVVVSGTRVSYCRVIVSLLADENERVNILLAGGSCSGCLCSGGVESPHRRDYKGQRQDQEVLLRPETRGKNEHWTETHPRTKIFTIHTQAGGGSRTLRSLPLELKTPNLNRSDFDDTRAPVVTGQING